MHLPLAGGSAVAVARRRHFPPVRSQNMATAEPRARLTTETASTYKITGGSSLGCDVN